MLGKTLFICTDAFFFSAIFKGCYRNINFFYIPVMLFSAKTCVIYKGETLDLWGHQIHGVNPKTVRWWFLPLNIHKFDSNVIASSQHSISSSFVYNGQMKFEIYLKRNFLDFSKCQHYVHFCPPPYNYTPTEKPVLRWIKIIYLGFKN